jgi:nitroimidazol reductase NimA-like FMN-containing flavoprotein (pyridoxamine 5'-phosphate oxidase superfamily)
VPIPRSALRLDSSELEELLSSERTCRVGTARDGEPHVVPLWFVWLDGTMYFNNLRRSRRTKDIERGSRVSVCVDAGEQYSELRGIVMYGRLEDASSDPRSAQARQMFGDKYFNGIAMPQTKSHAWLKLVPDKTVSWDFKKIPAGRDRRAEASRGS